MRPFFARSLSLSAATGAAACGGCGGCSKPRIVPLARPDRAQQVWHSHSAVAGKLYIHSGKVGFGPMGDGVGVRSAEVRKERKRKWSVR